uniref:Olfactory receptor n=1 Tax=Spermophilus dauricus TaxID=99837 RepID=A0A8C9UWW6_SPEDA
MEKWNQTSKDFILLGLLPPNQTGLLLLLLIIFAFVLALVGNSRITVLIFLDPRLHTPMYFLLSQLSLMDLMYISTTVPKMAINFLSGHNSISFLGCGVQIFFFITIACSEGLILASMAYDRFVAICHPLHYPVRMSKIMCLTMIIGTWILGSIHSLAYTTYALHLPYCKSRAINHFLCEIPSMMPLVCMDTWDYEYMLFVILILLLPFLGITLRKAFTTCSTHLTVVTILLCSFCLHLSPVRSPEEDKNLAVFYTILTPMLNPIIYSLRNKEVLGAMRRMCGMFSPWKK